jgi:RNA polymerase sigma-70 factor (ECF subfamily)
MGNEEADLGRRFAARDPEAIREIYRRYVGPMLVLARSLLADPDLAHDAVQQAFLQAWRAASRFEPDRPLSPWLFAIARRACIDLYRRERRRPALTTTGDAPERPDPVTGGDVEQAWMVWQVREAIETLSPEERDVIRLAYLEGFSLPEVAERLRIPVGTVKSRTFRAHRRLAHRLAYVRDDAPRTPRRGSGRTARPGRRQLAGRT